MPDTLYYEAHITLPNSAIVDEQALKVAREHKFNVSAIDGDGDKNAFILTTREREYETLKNRMISLMHQISWARYKVELVTVDSNINDEWSLRAPNSTKQ